MALARSRVTSGAWGKATCSASLQLTYFDPGARSGCSQVPLPRLLKRLTRLAGSGGERMLQRQRGREPFVAAERAFDCGVVVVDTAEADVDTALFQCRDLLH